MKEEQEINSVLVLTSLANLIDESKPSPLVEAQLQVFVVVLTSVWSI